MWLLDPIGILFRKDDVVVVVRTTVLCRGMPDVDIINLSLMCPSQGFVQSSGYQSANYQPYFPYCLL